MPTSVTLGGTVTANQASANAQFEFGTTSAYGSQTPGQTIAGLTPTSVSAALSGLSPNTVYHYRLVATSPDGTTMSADATFTTAGNLRPVLKPALTLLAIKPASFFAAPAKRGRKTGATISYLDAVAGRTTFVVFKETAGMRVHGRCLKLPKHRHRPSCVRQIKLGGFTHGDRAGRNTLHFSGRLASKRLAPGRYLLRATPRLGAMTGPTVTIGFRIL
jgi:hypothetical protein